MAIRVGETQVQPAKIAASRQLQSVVCGGCGILNVVNTRVSLKSTQRVGTSATTRESKVESWTRGQAVGPHSIRNRHALRSFPLHRNAKLIEGRTAIRRET